MSQQTYRLYNVTRGCEITRRVFLAKNGWARAIGWMGRRAVAAEEALWLMPCNGIHTLGMRFPIDALVLDRDRRVVRILSSIPPNRIVFPVRGGHGTIEFRAGALAGSRVEIGDQMVLEPVPEPTS